LLTFVASLRLASAVVFVLVSLLTAISTGAPGMAAHVLLTLAAATSFLVDIREGTSTSSAEKYGCCSIAFCRCGCCNYWK
jgi:hypothetical protein